MSLNRLLTENEIEDIVYQLQSIYPLNLNIRQHYSETCVEYSNGLSPYHIELEYL